MTRGDVCAAHEDLMDRVRDIARESRETGLQVAALGEGVKHLTAAVERLANIGAPSNSGSGGRKVWQDIALLLGKWAFAGGGMAAVLRLVDKLIQ